MNSEWPMLLPHIMAALNLTTIVLVSIGYNMVRKKKYGLHQRFMISSGSVLLLFLVCYVTYHVQVGNIEFGGLGSVRTFYFTLLILHVSGAVTSFFLIPMTFAHALRGQFDKHQRLARWTLPLWLFVSSSGLLVYLMAFHLFPPV